MAMATMAMATMAMATSRRQVQTRMALLMVLFVALLASPLSAAATATTTPAACTAGQGLFFLNAPRVYDYQSQLNVNRGALLTTTAQATLATQTITLNMCVQRGAFLFVASTGATGTANRVTVTLNGVAIANNTLITPGTVSSSVTSQGTYANIDPGAFINVTGLSGYGGSTTATSTFTVRISNLANTCTPVTYTYTLINPTCASTSPTCALATGQGLQICTEQNCNSPVYGNFQSYRGGEPATYSLTTTYTGANYWLKFGNSDLAKITLRVNGLWVVSSSGTTSSLTTVTPYVFASGPRYTLTLPWNSLSKNMLWFNISGYQASRECYEEGFQFIFGNPGVALTDACPLKASGSCTGARGDPQFLGLRGQSYQVHGIDGGIYNIISNTAMQLNSKFVFLTGPRDCPVLPSTGEPALACWSHDGSYLADMALKTAAGDRVTFTPGPAADGFATVMVNDEPVAVGQTVPLRDTSGPAQGSLQRVSSHELVLRVNFFEIHFENVDGFINLSHVGVVVSADPSVNAAASAFVQASRLRALRTHGLLGQTWRVHKFKNRLKVIEGEVDDYLIGSNDLFGDDFMYNRFGEGASSSGGDAVVA